MEATTSGTSSCLNCGEHLPYSGKGRPRLYCRTCRPVKNERDIRRARRMNKIAARQRVEARKLAKSASATGEFYAHSICLWCGDPHSFIASGENIGCSEACSKKLARAAWMHQRILGYRAASRYDQVHRGRIYHRDHGVCQLCGVAVPPPNAVPVECGNAAQLDHIVPVADGGDHTLENLRLAHNACNNAAQAGYRTSRARRRAGWQDDD